MDTQTSLLQTIDTTTNSILQAVGGENNATTTSPKDANTALLQNIASTTESILEAVEAGGGGGESDNYLTTDGEQTVSNKTLDDTNTFPSTLVDTSSSQTVSNKTLDSTNTFPSTLVDIDSTQTLGWKTLATSCALNYCKLSLNNLKTSTGRTITFPNATMTVASTTTTQTLSNKSLDSTNKLSSGTLLSASGNTITFPDTTATLATTADIPSVVSYQLWDFSPDGSSYFLAGSLYGKVYPNNGVLLLFGQMDVSYSPTTKTLLSAGTLYLDTASSVSVDVHSNPTVTITIPNNANDDATITNAAEATYSFAWFAVITGWTTCTINDSVVTRLL